jgi:hypothetical protein
MDIEEFRKSAHQTIDFICDYYKNIEKYPVQSQVKPGEIASKMPKEAPQGKVQQNKAMDFDHEYKLEIMSLMKTSLFAIYFIFCNSLY